MLGEGVENDDMNFVFLSRVCACVCVCLGGIIINNMVKKGSTWEDNSWSITHYLFI